VTLFPLYFDDRFRFAACAPFFPSAVRVFLDRCEIVFFFFAAVAAFLMFLRAAAFCFAVAMCGIVIGQSALSATTGSTCVARRAGM
jgi:hypothetical protein